MEHIDNFIKRVRSRLNRHLGLTVFIGSLAAGGVFTTLAALIYIIRGYHVPLFWYPVVFTVCLFAGMCCWYFLRHSHYQAAKFTDDYFSLKDGVRSYSGFHKAGKSSGFYALQAQQTDKAISAISLKSIRYKCPTCLVALAIVLILASALLGFKDDSPRIVQKRQQEQFVIERTQLINEQINEITEQIRQELEEKKLNEVVDINEIRQRVNELQETPDIKDAMRQYAQLERELGEVLSKLTQRQTEQLLERMGKQLQKDDATKALGNQLTQKEYSSASKEMQEFKIDPQAAMEIQKDQIEKLKAMAARMSEEAARSQTGTSQQSSDGQSQNNQQNNQTQKDGSQKNQQSSTDRLAQMAQQLNQSAQQMNQAMQEAIQNQAQNGQQFAGQMQQMSQNANQNLNNLGQFLQQMSARQQAQSMMQGMLGALAQSQQGLGNMPCPNGSGQTPANSPNPGGLEAGYGTSNAKNTEPGKDAPNGQITQLQGTHGAGPSITSSQESASGAGSNIGTLERELEEYMRQVESFVRREDVPEAVKAGVKAYFENIHNIDEGN
ncbi:MAG: hypothetical protein JW787_10715 [Sedimentisphaerales bacterium]|nr:hypothetical protein [Sedimentisphaerales bacterium]